MQFLIFWLLYALTRSALVDYSKNCDKGGTCRYCDGHKKCNRPKGHAGDCTCIKGHKI